MSKTAHLVSLRTLAVTALFTAVGLFAGAGWRTNAADEAPSEFARPVIDFGLCCRDVEKSVDFYTKAIGFTERKGFSAPSELTVAAGLTSGPALEIRVLSLGEGPDATNMKLMSVPGVETADAKNEFIHSQTGYRYTTILVKDMTKSLERLKAAGVPLVAQSPVALPAALAEGFYLTVIRDPDGNLVELVGPMKK
ncbi:MAG: VOC family protein [Planctomycetia bacterium]